MRNCIEPPRVKFKKKKKNKSAARSCLSHEAIATRETRVRAFQTGQSSAICCYLKEEKTTDFSPLKFTLFFSFKGLLTF